MSETLKGRVVRNIRKYFGGGLGNLSDPEIPRAEVEIYIRDANGATFYVSSLAEGLTHLLSNEGYRLGIKEWPDGADFGREQFGVTVWRGGTELAVALITPFTSSIGANGMAQNRVVFDLDKPARTPAQVQEGIQVMTLSQALGEPEPELSWEDLAVEEEVVIDGTQQD